jgi:hypothetical protein
VKKDRLKDLEEDLNSFLPSFSGKSSLDGVLAPRYIPPPAPVLPNKRVKDALEQRKNWATENPEDGSDSLDNPFGEPSQRKRRSTGWEDYYNSIDSRSKKKPGDALTDRDPFGLTKTRDQEDRTPAAVRQSEKKLQEQGEKSSLFSGWKSGSSFSDFFGLGYKGPTREDLEAHKTYMQQYQQLLDSGANSRATATLNPLAPSATVTVPTSSGLDAYVSSASKPLSSSARLDSVLNPARLDDPNSVLNQWNPLYSPSGIYEPPKRPSTSVPMVEVPRRKF